MSKISQLQHVTGGIIKTVCGSTEGSKENRAPTMNKHQSKGTIQGKISGTNAKQQIWGGGGGGRGQSHIKHRKSQLPGGEAPPWPPEINPAI